MSVIYNGENCKPTGSTYCTSMYPGLITISEIIDVFMEIIFPVDQLHNFKVSAFEEDFSSGYYTIHMM